MVIRTLQVHGWSAALVVAALCVSVSANAQAVGDSVAMMSDSARSETEFRAATARYSPAVRGCYEREGLRTDPRLTAIVEVGFTVPSSGIVRDISVDTVAVTGVGIENVTRCVAQAAATWRFQPGAYTEERAVLTFKLLAPRSASNP